MPHMQQNKPYVFKIPRKLTFSTRYSLPLCRKGHRVFLINKAQLFSQNVIVTLLKYSGVYSVDTLGSCATNYGRQSGPEVWRLVLSTTRCYLLPGVVYYQVLSTTRLHSCLQHCFRRSISLMGHSISPASGLFSWCLCSFRSAAPIGRNKGTALQGRPQRQRQEQIWKLNPSSLCHHPLVSSDRAPWPSFSCTTMGVSPCYPTSTQAQRSLCSLPKLVLWVYLFFGLPPLSPFIPFIPLLEGQELCSTPSQPAPLLLLRNVSLICFPVKAAGSFTQNR